MIKNNKQKEMYAAPLCELHQLHLEGVIAQSPTNGLENFQWNDYVEE